MIKDVAVFFFVFVIAWIAFGNAFFIMVKNSIENPAECTPEYLNGQTPPDKCKTIIGDGFWNALFHAWRLGGGDF